MSIMITGDLHCSVEERDRYRFELLDRLPGLMHDRGISHLVVLGDLTDKKDNHSSWLVNRIVGWFKAVSDVCDVIVLKGNHDYTDPAMPFFKFLDHMDGVTFVNEPSELALPIGPTLFLPHTANHDRDWADLDFGDYSFIFAHNTFEGAMSNGTAMHGIPLEVFADGNTVISGDIHEAQWVGGVVRYVGAPYLINFGDAYAPRVLTIGDDGVVVSIPTKGRQKRLIEIPYQQQPRDRPHHVFQDDAGEAIAYSLGTLTPGIGDIVKLRVTLSEQDQEHWPSWKAGWIEWAQDQGFTVWSVQPVIQRRTAGTSTRSTPRAMDDDGILTSYARARKIGDRVLKTGRIIAKKI